MRKKILTAITATLVAGLGVEHARAQQTLRVQRTQRGDIVAIGNTFGFECSEPEPYPVLVGEVGDCGVNTDDSTPDLFWRSEPNGTTSATLGVGPADARSGAVLTLEDDASVSRAFLYWMGTDDLDSEIVLDGPGFEGLTITAQGSATAAQMYQAWADVTAPVSLSGSGFYQVSGVDSRDLRNVSGSAASAWTLIVLTEDPGAPTRNLAVFDGLDWVTPPLDEDPAFETTLSGFLVPSGDFVARLGVVTYEGDASLVGDQLLVNGTPQGTAIAGDVNPSNNFFNGTRSSAGVAVSVAGDLPQLSGGPSSMGGYDLDEINISSTLTPGATSMVVGAATTLDQFALGIFYTSIEMVAPDFTTSVKSASYEGTLNPGEEVTFTITLRNSGVRTGQTVTLTDALPPEMIYVPGSATLSGAPVTDQAGDDRFEFLDGELTFRPGAGDDSLIPPETEVVVTFRVTVAEGFSGTLSNQAEITAFGQQGEGPFTWLTRSPAGVGPTTVEVTICEFSDDCPDGLLCLAEGESSQCVECLSDDDCGLGICSERNACECVSGVACTVGVGACERTGTVACGAKSITCDAEPGEPSVELCGDEIDSDCDGALSNGCSADPDDDGLTTEAEQGQGTDPFDADTDNDGVIDGEEAVGDSDGDGLIDALDVDSDNDGLLDGTEVGSQCEHPDSEVGAKPVCVRDEDPVTTTDPTNPDTDGGTVFDGTEDIDRDGQLDDNETDPNRPEDDLALLCSDAVPCPDNLVCAGGICIEPCEAASCGEFKVCDPVTRLCIDRCEDSDACAADEVCDVEQGLCVTDPETKPETGVLVDGAGLRCSATVGYKYNKNKHLMGSMAALVLLVLHRRRRDSRGLSR